MKRNKVILWLPSILLLGSMVLLGVLWMLSLLPQLYDFRRALLDGFAVALALTVVIVSLVIASLNRSWIALLPVAVVAIFVFLRESRQHDTHELERAGRLQAEAYASESFGVKFKDGKLLSSDNDK